MRFKPYYNWNTFNTTAQANGVGENPLSFKPYYNWNTFNTAKEFKKQVKEILF